MKVSMTVTVEPLYLGHMEPTILSTVESLSMHTSEVENV